MDRESLANQILFAKEAADFLGISVQRLNQLVHEGKIHCLKKNSSSTLFHIDDLKSRREEISIFEKNTCKRGDYGVFTIDNKMKQEALNFATIMELLMKTESTVEPIFNDIGNFVDLYRPIDDISILSEYANQLNISQNIILQQYNKSKFAFSTLRPDDIIISRDSELYPKRLLSTEQAPRFLYLRGNISLLRETRVVALVGSRKASENAQAKTRRLAKMLGENGITVISGLAKGIDVNAHSSALENGFNTIAVIGTHLNQYYPIENKSIQEEIEKRGLIVSQFSPASQTQRWHFPMRNGLMSGLSLATVIIEAGETSGALKQADYALKQNRLVLIPQSALDNPAITWPNKYVKSGAKVVQTSLDIIRELANDHIYINDQKKPPVQQSLFNGALYV